MFAESKEDARVVARLVLVTAAVLLVGAFLGLVMQALLARSFVRATRRPALSDLIAATGLMAGGALAALGMRAPAAEPVLRSIGRALVAPGSALPPWHALRWILAGAGAGLLGCLLLRTYGVRESRARALSRSTPRSSSLRLTSISRLDLCLWSRERQGMTLAVVAQVFWILLCVYCVAESTLGSAQIARPADHVRLQESVAYLMPIGWAFFSTLSLGLTDRGGRQLLGAPLDTLELLWRKFIAALAFSGVQWALCAIFTGYALGNLALPPGLSVIAALFVLANACAFVGGS